LKTEIYIGLSKKKETKE